VSLWCGNFSAAPVRETIDGIDVRRRGGRLTNALWSMSRYLSRRHDFDVIVDYTCQLHFLTPLYVRQPRVAVAMHVVGDAYRHDLRFPIGHALARWEAFSLRHLYGRERFVAISDSTSGQLRRLGIPSDRIRVVQCGRREPAPVLQGRRAQPTLVYFGRLKRYKRLDLLIRVLPDIRRRVPDVRLDVVGAGDQLPALRRLVLDLGLEEAVSFHGRLPDRRLWEVVSAAWINVQPSLVEGWGMTVVEAAQCSVPTIASRAPGLRDTVVEGRTGLLFASDNPQELVEHVSRLLLDVNLRESYGEAAERWAAGFSWTVAADEFEAVLEQVVAGDAAHSLSQAPPPTWPADPVSETTTPATDGTLVGRGAGGR